MLLDISGNSFTSLGNPQDADVERFISATSITDSTQITAINNLVFGLKTNNLWNKMQAIYPFVGGNANSHKYNLKDPRDVDAAFRLVFSGSWTHTSTGMKLTTQSNLNYANSFYNPASSSTLNDAHLSIYIRDVGIGAVVPIGVNDTNTTFFQINTSSGASVANTIINTSTVSFPSTTLGNTVGLLLGSRTASTSTVFYVNGVSSGSSAGASTTRPNLNVFLGTRNNNISGLDFPSNQEIAFSSIGLGLTASEASTFSTIVQAFQTTLGRQVGTSVFSPNRPIQFNIPTVIYTPPQIFGNNLLSWYDFNDTSTLYTDSGLTTNVVNNNDLILGVRNKGTGNGRNYNLIQTFPITNVHQYKKDAINSNKNLANFTGSTANENLKTIDNYILSSTTSSYTFSFCYKNPLTTGDHILFTLSQIPFIQVISIRYNATSNVFDIRIKDGVTPNGGNLFSFSLAVGALQATELRYNVFTLTINPNSLVTLYHNDDKTTIQGNTNIHPISNPTVGSSQKGYINWSVGGSNQVVSTINSQILEMVISDNICATDDQVNKLRQYFKIKYNI